VPEGLETMESLLKRWQAEGARLRGLTCGYVMGTVYARLFQGAIQTTGCSDSPSVRAFADNAIRWFSTCAAEAETTGARVLLGQVRLEWGKLLSVMNQPEAAARQLRQSIEIFENSDAPFHLEHAIALLRTLGQ
jgi:hypothetical protein